MKYGTSFLQMTRIIVILGQTPNFTRVGASEIQFEKMLLKKSFNSMNVQYQYQYKLPSELYVLHTNTTIYQQLHHVFHHYEGFLYQCRLSKQRGGSSHVK